MYLTLVTRTHTASQKSHFFPNECCSSSSFLVLAPMTAFWEILDAQGSW